MARPAAHGYHPAHRSGTDPASFVQRWHASGGAERANYQLFLSERCDLLAVPRPDPTGHASDDYVFECAVTLPRPDGTTRHGRIDFYKQL